MKRGDVVTVAGAGDYAGKLRPALVVQSDLYNETHASLTLCLITSEFVDAPLFRVSVMPSPGNGLAVHSQVMVDKLASVPRAKIGAVIGSLDAGVLAEVNRALKRWLGV